MDIINFKPKGGALAEANPDYKVAVAQFARAVRSVITPINDIVEVNLDFKDAVAVKNIHDFLLWTRSFTKEQWAAGVPLPSTTIYEVAGRSHHCASAERTACLLKVTTGNRRLGISNTYTLSQPHLLGLARFLAKAAAYNAACMAREIEAVEERLLKESELESLLLTREQREEREFQETMAWSDAIRNKHLEVPREVRVQRCIEELQREKRPGKKDLGEKRP